MMKKALLLGLTLSLLGMGGALAGPHHTVPRITPDARLVKKVERSKVVALKKKVGKKAKKVDAKKRYKTKDKLKMDRYFHRFRHVDADGDHRISLEEMAAYEVQQMKASFDRLDLDHDGLLSKSELRRER